LIKTALKGAVSDMATGDTLLNKIERLVFGATAAERVEMLVELATRRIEQRLVAALERLAAEETEEEDTQEDDDGEPQQCAECGMWEVYGAASLCATCRPDDEEDVEGKEGSDG
jgi:hypothetical protein